MWFKVDDSLYSHPKAIEAGEALASWVRAGAWCAQHLTDGLVPRSMVRMLCMEGHADTLVEVGLWSETPDGYVFHDWHDYQPSRSDVQERRNKRASAGRLGGLNSGRSRREASASASADPVALPMANPRTRTRTYKEEGAQSTPNAKGARLPDGWLPDQSVVDALKAELGKDAGWFKAEHRKFTDHWQAESGQRASKRDWNAAYRLWCRRGAENNVRRIPAPTTAPIDRLWAEAGAEQ